MKLKNLEEKLINKIQTFENKAKYGVKNLDEKIRGLESEMKKAKETSHKIETAFSTQKLSLLEWQYQYSLMFIFT